MSIGIRPHHALCAQFFVGKGCSESFVTHMYGILSELKEDSAVVTLVDGCDAICEGCPNHREGVCETDEKVRAIDRRAIEAMGLRFFDTLPWRELSETAKQRIILPGSARMATNRRPESMRIGRGNGRAFEQSAARGLYNPEISVVI